MRHGLREDSDPVRWCESLKHMDDPDIQPLGVKMAELAADRLVGQGIDHVIASPFLRTIRSAAVIARKLKLPVKIDYSFHEMLEPKWFPAGIPRLPLPAERAVEFPEIDLSYTSVGYPLYTEMLSPETRFHERVFGGFEAVLDGLEGNVLIMTHYAVANCLKKHITGSLMDGYIELTSIFKYVWRGNAWNTDILCDSTHVVPLYPKPA
jgi:broad specificity phosphatase PhoE